MIWGVIATLPEEIELLVMQMHMSESKTISGYIFYSGIIGKTRIVLVNCGGGKINAAVCTTLLVAEFSVKTIFSIGVSGSLSEKLKILDVVIADKLLYHDNDLKFAINQPPYQPFYTADTVISERCKQVVNGMMGGNFIFETAPIATGDRFISDNVEKTEISARTGALCVDMCGAAVAQAAAIHEVPFVVIRCISDDTEGITDQDYEKYFRAAAEQPCYILLELFSR